MEGSLILLLVLSLFLGAGCWLFFLWGVKRGEFDDLERSKFRMLDDDLPQQPPTGGHDAAVGETDDKHDG